MAFVNSDVVNFHEGTVHFVWYFIKATGFNNGHAQADGCSRMTILILDPTEFLPVNIKYYFILFPIDTKRVVFLGEIYLRIGLPTSVAGDKFENGHRP